jgi:hypothetical protein
LARQVVLNNESRTLFRRGLKRLIAEFRPTTPSEYALVEEMAVNRWRLERVWAIEAHRLQSSLPRVDHGDQLARIAAAFRDYSTSGSEFSTLQTYEARLSRQFHSGIRTLKQQKLANELPPGGLP